MKISVSRKNIIIIVVALIAVIALGYFYWAAKRSSVQAPVGDVTQSATQGTIPSIGDATNPLGNRPDLNPADKANPFTSVKTNPFQ